MIGKVAFPAWSDGIENESLTYINDKRAENTPEPICESHTNAQAARSLELRRRTKHENVVDLVVGLVRQRESFRGNKDSLHEEKFTPIKPRPPYL